MDMCKYKSVIEEGDLVIVYLSVRSMYPIVLKHNEVFQNKYGALKHNDVIGKRYGSIVNCSKGYVYVLFPTPELWTVTLPHRTQILYFPDISLISLQLDLKPGCVVCEAGTGSGSLSHAIARSISPSGKLHTFDFHEQRVEVAKTEFESHGLGNIVEVKHRDVAKEGFGLDHVANAVFLDLPQPWEVIPHVAKAMKLEGGRVCSFSPCIEQVQQTCIALQSHGFRDITTVECLLKQFEVKRITMSVLKTEDNCQDKPNATENAETKSSDKVEAASNSFANRGVSNQSFWSANPPLQTQGHSGYLTFCTLLPRKEPQEEKMEIKMEIE